MKTKINTLKINGFVNLGNNILELSEIIELKNLTNLIFNNLKHDNLNKIKHPDYISSSTGVEGVMRITQHDSRIHFLINKIFSNKELHDMLINLLGINFKIWQINFRKSAPGDSGLDLHQDSKGELGLCLILDDNPNGDGSTIFIPGTHLFKKRMIDLKVSAPKNFFKYVMFLFKKLKGKKGDIAVFFNRTWHGRASNKTNKNFDVILIGLIPNGGILTYENYGNWDENYLNNCESAFNKLINPSINTQKIDQHNFIINNDDSQEPYSIKIEKGYKFLPKPPLFTFFTYIFLKYSTIFIRTLRKYK